MLSFYPVAQPALIIAPDVDPERIAYIGGSFGEAMGGLFAGVEDRVKASVLQVLSAYVTLLVYHVAGIAAYLHWDLMDALQLFVIAQP